MRILILLISLGLAVGPALAVNPDTAGPLTNPAVNTICADTGPLPESNFYLSVWVSSTVAGVFVLEHRNVGNTGNVMSHIFPLPASGNFTWISSQFNPQVGERVRVRLNAAITGAVQCSLWRQ